MNGIGLKCVINAAHVSSAEIFRRAQVKSVKLNGGMEIPVYGFGIF